MELAANVDVIRYLKVSPYRRLNGKGLYKKKVILLFQSLRYETSCNKGSVTYSNPDLNRSVNDGKTVIVL